MRALGFLNMLLLALGVCSFTLPCHAKQTDQLSERHVRAEVRQQYEAYKQGGKHRMQLLDEEADLDFDAVIQKGDLVIEEGYFSGRDRLEAMALLRYGENSGPDWGLPNHALLAHYACVQDHWELIMIETWFSDLAAQDVDADGIHEIWVRQVRDGQMAGAETRNLMSYEGGSWRTLWEFEGSDRLAHTDFEQDPPKSGDVLMEMETAEFRWKSGQDAPIMFVRREVRTCSKPQCNSVEDLETRISWKKMVRTSTGYQIDPSPAP